MSRMSMRSTAGCVDFPRPASSTQRWRFRVFTNFMKAHAEAYHTIKELDKIDADGDGQASMVGIAQLIVPVEAFNAFNPTEQALAYTTAHFINSFWLRTNQTGVFDPEVPLFFGPFESYPRIKNTLDFIGINYYSRQIVRLDLGGAFWGTPPEAPNVSQLGIEIYPPGLKDSLMTVVPFGLPIVITENGIADATDKDRAQYIVSHLGRAGEVHPRQPECADSRLCTLVADRQLRMGKTASHRASVCTKWTTPRRHAPSGPAPTCSPS